MFNSGYPTANFEVNDVSGASTDELFRAPTEGLHVPFSFILAERGEPGRIYFGSAADLVPELGASTFDPTSPFYNPATLYTGTGMNAQGVEVMRLVDPDAKTASFALTVSVVKKDLTQYKKTADGARIVNNSGGFVPRTAPDGVTIIKEPGVSVRWAWRKLEDNEFFDELLPVTTNNGGVVTKTYPVIGGLMRSPGKYGDRQGMTLFSSPVKGSAEALATKTCLYRLIPMELPTDVSTTASPIADIYGSSFNDFSFKDRAVYANTNTNLALRSIIDNAYVNFDTGRDLLPYDLKVYGEYIGEIGQEILDLSPELDDIDPYQIDLIAGTDLDGNLYDHLDIDAASASVVNSTVTKYAEGGTDGDTSWAKFETLVQDWLVGSDYGEFPNLQQHPMTHFYDPGFSMPVKILCFNMMGLRDNLKLEMTTQDISRRANTKAEDISAGQALLFRAQMYPQSIINGVGAMRVSIYAHAAKLVAGLGYDGLVPFNYNRLIQRSLNDGGSYVKGSAAGMPNSVVTRFRKPNWVADDKPSQALAWASCINVVRHADRVTIIYPSYRTVYNNDTSLLSDDETVDYICYMYKIGRYTWAKYSGVKDPAETLFGRIENDINLECANAFSLVDTKVNAQVGRTANDRNLGTQLSIKMNVLGNLPARIFNFDVVVGRATE